MSDNYPLEDFPETYIQFTSTDTVVIDGELDAASLRTILLRIDNVIHSEKKYEPVITAKSPKFNFVQCHDADPTKTYTVELGTTYREEPVIVKITGVSGESFRQGFGVYLTPNIEG